MIVGFTCSAFDLLHAGHISMLAEAKNHCDYLLCGLHVDPNLDRIHKNKPIQSVVERYTQLNAVKYVDEIIPYETENHLLDILALRKIDIRVIGEEYKGKPFTGKSICESKGIEILYNDRDHNFSSTELRQRIKSNEI